MARVLGSAGIAVAKVPEPLVDGPVAGRAEVAETHGQRGAAAAGGGVGEVGGRVLEDRDEVGLRECIGIHAITDRQGHGIGAGRHVDGGRILQGRGITVPEIPKPARDGAGAEIGELHNERRAARKRCAREVGCHLGMCPQRTEEQQ